MHRYLAAVVLAAAVLALAGACLAQETVSTRPETPAEKPDEPALTEVHTFAKWACVLSGLALAGVLWVGWSMQTLARNQVELGKLIRSQGPGEKG
ncbi:unnamed protein product [marine sediment metagenome]|uniref:Uncharacterized protein n=1 Tax=marine sediment metagenome TaxID=412755 RepID=X0XLT1_9ZZZZ